MAHFAVEYVVVLRAAALAEGETIQMRLLRLLPCLALIWIVSGCGSDLVRDKVQGPYYFQAIEAAEQTQLVKSRTGVGLDQAIVIVPSPIVAAGWDLRWVIMQQGPEQDWTWNTRRVRRQEADKFFVFRLTDEKLFVPFDAVGFKKARRRLKVSPFLTFTKHYAEP